MALSGGRDVESGGLQGRLYASVQPAGVAGGTGGRPTYVLLHGIGVSHRYLARLHRELAEAADVYSFDLPGFGKSSRPQRQLQVEDFAAFVSAVLADAGVSTYVPVGHSMGTQFAVELALKEPDRVAGAVLMGPVVEPSRKTVAQQALALTRDSMFSESLTSNAIVFSDYFRAGPRWYLTELPVMMEYPLEERLAGVRQPVLVLRGTRDPIARRPWCENLAGVAPQGIMAEVLGQGHVFQHTAPAIAAQAISGWVRAVNGFGVTA
ncbi:pimeloyl-ACP methyl ester carboxylesterase [Pseudarthrobacter siccitolerans]|uniref:Pimeloyl-ACP methyl ester carboxylesterase n=1 Tax=Pseudarthrobacter siccitolerans TaxID=861266 RepID=A0ABU0PM85_9MICC|nr:alpha/beta hydrolase [Pseudarthrobacter siccitolerans]MDQ0674827.1 pimeloyl-ACP methyl ester carboxylesterase [Pseudarthrobacter siccitolerans]